MMFLFLFCVHVCICVCKHKTSQKSAPPPQLPPGFAQQRASYVSAVAGGQCVVFKACSIEINLAQETAIGDRQYGEHTYSFVFKTVWLKSTSLPLVVPKSYQHKLIPQGIKLRSTIVHDPAQVIIYFLWVQLGSVLMGIISVTEVNKSHDEETSEQFCMSDQMKASLLCVHEFIKSVHYELKIRILAAGSNKGELSHLLDALHRPKARKRSIGSCKEWTEDEHGRHVNHQWGRKEQHFSGGGLCT